MAKALRRATRMAEDVATSTPILIGGTGGVRDGIRSSTVSAAQIESFERLLSPIILDMDINCNKD